MPSFGIRNGILFKNMERGNPHRIPEGRFFLWYLWVFGHDIFRSITLQIPRENVLFGHSTMKSRFCSKDTIGFNKRCGIKNKKMHLCRAASQGSQFARTSVSIRLSDECIYDASLKKSVVPYLTFRGWVVPLCTETSRGGLMKRSNSSRQPVYDVGLVFYRSNYGTDMWNRKRWWVLLLCTMPSTWWLYC